MATNLPGAYPVTAPLNYVRVYEPQRPYTLETEVSNPNRTVEEVKKTTQYFDGLGRPLQTVAWQQSTDKKDIVSANVYNQYGQEEYKYLPFVASVVNGSVANDGNLKYPFRGGVRLRLFDGVSAAHLETQIKTGLQPVHFFSEMSPSL